MKDKISITIDKETLSKVDENILKNIFRNRSHVFEYCVNKLIEENINIEG